MTTLLVLAALLVLLGAVALVRVVLADGYGHRPPPASRYDDAPLDRWTALVR